MKWASSVSELPNLDQAIDECITGLLSSLGDTQPDLAVVFISPHFEPEYSKVIELISQGLGPVKIFGCSGGGIIGDGVRTDECHRESG